MSIWMRKYEDLPLYDTCNYGYYFYDDHENSVCQGGGLWLQDMMWDARYDIAEQYKNVTYLVN